MTDDTSQKKDDGKFDPKTGKGKSSMIKADSTKSEADYIAEAENYYIVPKLVRDIFPDLLKLIFETESMDEDEREYWLQIMPIMTEEQIRKFREILVNEKEQLDKLDKEYETEMSQLEEKHNTALDEEEMKKKREELRSKEKASESQESQEEAALLKKLDEI